MAHGNGNGSGGLWTAIAAIVGAAVGGVAGFSGQIVSALTARRQQDSASRDAELTRLLAELKAKSEEVVWARQLYDTERIARLEQSRTVIQLQTELLAKEEQVAVLRRALREAQAEHPPLAGPYPPEGG